MSSAASAVQKLSSKHRQDFTEISFLLDIKSRVAFKQFWGRLRAKSLRPLAITQHLSTELH